MNRILSSVLVSIMCMGLITSEGIAQCLPDVRVLMLKRIYNLDEVLDLQIIVQNVCDEDIIIADTFDDVNVLNDSLVVECTDTSEIILSENLSPGGVGLPEGGPLPPYMTFEILRPGDQVLYEFPDLRANGYPIFDPCNYKIRSEIGVFIFEETTTLDGQEVALTGGGNLIFNDQLVSNRFEMELVGGCDANAAYGDFNGNGMVDFDDYSLVDDCIGQPPTGSCACTDITGDGDVDTDDLDLVGERLGSAAP